MLQLQPPRPRPRPPPRPPPPPPPFCAPLSRSGSLRPASPLPAAATVAACLLGLWLLLSCLSLLSSWLGSMKFSVALQQFSHALQKKPKKQKGKSPLSTVRQACAFVYMQVSLDFYDFAPPEGGTPHSGCDLRVSVSVAIFSGDVDEGLSRRERRPLALAKAARPAGAGRAQRLGPATGPSDWAPLTPAGSHFPFNCARFAVGA